MYKKVKNMEYNWLILKNEGISLQIRINRKKFVERKKYFINTKKITAMELMEFMTLRFFDMLVPDMIYSKENEHIFYRLNKKNIIE